MVVEYFARLGGRIESEWKKLDYDEAGFPDLCAAALDQDSPIGKVAPSDVLAWVRTAPSIVPQNDIEARFGSPPITVFRGPRFYIAVLFWIDGSTSIHQHSFSGAFQVLEGTSIHATHRFEAQRVVSPRMMLGSLRADEVEYLRAGDIRKIASGRSFIHAHFHLDRPTTTLVVRTDEDPTAKPQWDYAPPGVALDPFFAEGHMNRKVQTVALLLATQRDQALPAIEEVICCSDLLTTFKVLSLARSHLLGSGLANMFDPTIGEDRFEGLLQVARRRHGTAVDLLVQCFAESQRRGLIMNKRRLVEDVDQRFLLAAVLNLPNRQSVLELIRRRHPDGNPAELAADWADALLRTRIGGTKANVLGVDGIDDLGIRAFELMIEGRSILDAVNAMRHELPDLPEGHIEKIVQHARAQFGASVLAPLVGDSQ